MIMTLSMYNTPPKIKYKLLNISVITLDIYFLAFIRHDFLKSTPDSEQISSHDLT
jgi:hypothetical protein